MPPYKLLHGKTTGTVPTKTAAKNGFGFFGRMFELKDDLVSHIPPGNSTKESEKALLELANAMFETDNAPNTDNPKIPAGYTYFGQFVDHDLTFDPVSSLERENDPGQLENFRTPRFDLDSLYGRGPVATPFLYDAVDNPLKLFVGNGFNHFSGVETDEDDLPRLIQHPGDADKGFANERAIAIIGDPRNDENVIVSQIQLAFIQFHNQIIDKLEADNPRVDKGRIFAEAQELVRWHYQWVVIHDFLKRIVDPEIVDSILPKPGSDEIRTKFFNADPPFMPVEFSVAAYRLGHSMVRNKYDLNQVVRQIPLFSPEGETNRSADLRGGRRLHLQWTLGWDRFLELDNANPPQLSRSLDLKLSIALTQLPGESGDRGILAFLNLLRGWRMGLPSGQAIAKRMGIEPLPVDWGSDLPSWRNETEEPLWYYILREAKVLGDGERLGPVGGQIVAEVFVRLLASDSMSYINVNPNWKPVFPAIGDGFQLRDIVSFDNTKLTNKLVVSDRPVDDDDEDEYSTGDEHYPTKQKPYPTAWRRPTSQGESEGQRKRRAHKWRERRRMTR
ncbi:MAG: heme peroxidase family protein [Pseudanabaenales cyanobacterium]|nr:heme peroxidase family protein [Pseudanabaenales cyanobacterium]